MKESVGSGWGVASGRDFLKPDRFTTVRWAQDGTAVSYKCPCQSPGEEALLPAEAPGPKSPTPPEAYAGRSPSSRRPAPCPALMTSGLSRLLSLIHQSLKEAEYHYSLPTPHPSRCESCGSRYLKSSEGRGHPGLLHSTKPAAWHTAGNPGDSSGATVPTQQPASHGPNSPLCLPTRAHTGWGLVEREGSGFQTIAQGQGPLYIWGLLQETYDEGRTLLPALFRAPPTWGVRYGLKCGVFRGRPAHNPSVYRERS